jgi:hypothetical protein
VLGRSEGDQGSSLWWLNDGKHGGTVAVKGHWRKRVAPWGGGSFYSQRRRLAQAA